MITIRYANNNDIESIVRIHSDAFKGFFLTSLGADFLKFYYSCFVKSKETIIMVAEENGEIYGFSASTKKSKGFNSRLIKHNFFSFGILSIKLLLKTPSALIRLIKNMKKKSADIKDNEDYAELYSIGVSKSAQGMGIGKRLLTSLEQAMKEAGVKQMSLTTDFYNNNQAIGFYHSLGYKILYKFIAYPNRKMYRLIKVL